MNTMTDSETYNGWKNRETWAFNLHWQNDQGLYNETLEVAHRALRHHEYDAEPWSDSALGGHVVNYWREQIEEADGMEWPANLGLPYPAALRMMSREVGSWWRIDCAEVGAAVRESLDAES